MDAMINYQRVRRIKNAIYTFLMLLFLLPVILIIILFVRTTRFQNDLERTMVQLDETMQSAASAFDRAIASYRVPTVPLLDVSKDGGEEGNPVPLETEEEESVDDAEETGNGETDTPNSGDSDIAGGESPAGGTGAQPDRADAGAATSNSGDTPGTSSGYNGVPLTGR